MNKIVKNKTVTAGFLTLIYLLAFIWFSSSSGELFAQQQGMNQ
jgi:hypothetical protein